MLNIRQRFVKSIISCMFLLVLAACDQVASFSNANKPMVQNVANIAVLLPISGSDAKLAKEYAQMIKIGLADSAKTKIRVTIYDCTDKEILNQSLNKIFEQGADIIVGSISSDDTEIVASKIHDKSTIILSLANNPVLADKNVLIFGHEPMTELTQITNYFLKHDYKNYIALLPFGRESTIASKILNNMINEADTNLSHVEFYKDSPEEIEKSIKLVAENVDNINENDFNIKQAVILLSGDMPSMEIVQAFINKNKLDKKAIIAGDGRININSAYHINEIFTGSVNLSSTQISTLTQKANIHHISSMHAIAYDAGQILGSYIGTNFNKKAFLQAIHSSEVFAGISGNIHFVDSIAQRQYDLLKKQDNKIKPLPEQQ